MATKPLWLFTTTLTGEITKSTSVETCTKKQVRETLDEFCFSGFVYLTSAFRLNIHQKVIIWFG